MAYRGTPSALSWSLGAAASWPLTGLVDDNTPDLDINFVSTMTLDSRITLTRATTVQGYDISGTLVDFGPNVPVFEYDATTHAPLGLRIDGESAAITTLTPWFNSSAGTLAVEIMRLRNDGGFPGFGFMASTGGGSANSIAMFSENNNFYGLVKTAGAFKYGPTLGTVTNGVIKKCALAYAVANYRAAHDGTLCTDDGSATGALPTISQFRLSGLDAAYTGYWRRLRYWNTGLDDATLQALTAS
jgi:hypothetical protein